MCASPNISHPCIDEFWDVVEEHFMCSIPEYLKNMLKYAGYDCVYTIKTITDEDLAYLEDFVKIHMKHFIEEHAREHGHVKLSEFYHIFKPENFHIPNGHKKLLLGIAKYVEENLVKNGISFFYPSKSRSKRRIDAVEEISRKCPKFEINNTSNPGSSIATDSTIEFASELPFNSSTILQTLVNSAERNFSRQKPGYRFDHIIKMFAAFIKMIGGLLTYETLHANLPLSLPSPPTVDRFLAEKGPKIVEGVLRTEELLDYLKSRNLPLIVSTAEDATRITAKISYDPSTNQLVGFALPLDSNGMPIPFSFMARDAKEIEKHFKNSANCISTSAYVQMVKPLDQNTPPFCLLLFLIDNKFTTSNVLRRWDFTKKELKKKGIQIYNVSGDGDSRMLMAMKKASELGVADRSFIDSEWYSCGPYSTTTYTQDGSHIVTKLRNWLLKVSRIYPIGQRIISNSHIKYMIRVVSKDKHLLTPYDIDPKDRQNVQSAEKICSLKSIQCILENVPGSEGTALFLKVMNFIVSVHLSATIKSSERIYKIWYAVFFFRVWRSWILNTKKPKVKKSKRKNTKPSTEPSKESENDFEDYTLKENFISSNAYTCIELNAHALVKKLLKPDEAPTSQQYNFGDVNKPFIPNLYGSQICESMFRQVRSFTSTFATVVNCNMLDIIHRIKKIQLQSDIVNTTKDKIRFPRFEKKINDEACNEPAELLSKSDIIMEIEKAKKDLTCDLEELGIKTSKLKFSCPIEAQNGLDFDLGREYDETDTETEENDCPDIYTTEAVPEEEPEDDENEILDGVEGGVYKLLNITGELSMRDYADTQIRLKENTRFTVVGDSTGKEKVVRKSGLCWLLSQNKFKLSSDRLQRVQERDYVSSLANQIGREGSNEDDTILNQYIVKPELHIGDWGIFRIQNDSQCTKNTVCIILGLVLGFSYLSGKSFKEKEFSRSSAPVKSDKTRGVGVLCSFYSFNDQGILIASFGSQSKHTFIGIESYVGTIKSPLYMSKKLTIPPELVATLNNLADTVKRETK